MKKFNLYGFITLFGILFLVILYKVIHLPVTTDELPTALFYSNFSFWKIMMYPDNIPNNHILNTLLVKCSMMIFGKEQWAIRLPSLLCFIVFGYGVFRILKLVLKPTSFYFLPAAILFINPYCLDFFGLCRGYAISITMVTFTIGFLIEGYLLKKPKLIWYSLLTSILASYANFSALVFWVATSAMVWFYFFIETKKDWRKLIKPTIILFFISVAYLALIITPIRKMQSTNEFQYWSSRGFYAETIKSLLVDWWYDSKILSTVSLDTWAYGLIFVVLISIFFFLRNLQKNKFSIQSFSHPTFVTTAIILLPAFVSIVQSTILKTPNLNGRTAMFFFPLISSVFATLLSLIPELKKQWIHKSLVAFAGVILVINLTSRVSLKYVKEWYYDQNTLEVINFIKEKSDGKPITLKTSWFFHPSFYFYTHTEKAPCIDLYCFDKNIEVTTSAEYYYIWADDYKQLEPRFEVVYKFSPDRWLLKQRIR
jgi:hypothetical protein